LGIPKVHPKRINISVKRSKFQEVVVMTSIEEEILQLCLELEKKTKRKYNTDDLLEEVYGNLKIAAEAE
jgi:hypothetical protein